MNDKVFLDSNILIYLYDNKICDELKQMYPVYKISVDDVFHALQISKETQFSYWDSLFLAAAIDIGCSTVYSEDLTNGQVIEGVKIVNPFL